MGTLLPTIELGTLYWAEFGARIGYRMTESLTLDAFANGVSGGSGIDTRVHVGGALRVSF